MATIDKEPLLLGSGVTLLGALRCLGSIGMRAKVISDKRTSPYRLSRYYHPALALGGEDLRTYLSTYGGPGAVLIPCSDRWARAVARLPREITARFPSSLPPASVLDRFLDKGSFAELLEEEDVPHPRTVVMEEDTNLTRLGHLEGFFIKPRDSQVFQERFGQKAIWPETVDALEEKVEWAMGEGLEMMLQEYIPGPASNHVFVDGFLDRSGDVKGVFARRRLRMHPPRFGNSSYMVSVRRWEVPAAVESITGLLKRVGYRGVFSAEFKWDDRDGLFKLLEVNARPWWFVEFAANCGINFIEMVYRDALNLEVKAVDEYAVGRYFIHPYYDISACSREASGGLRGLARFMASLPGADRPVLRWNDPLPAFGEFFSLAEKFLARRMGPRRK